MRHTRLISIISLITLFIITFTSCELFIDPPIAPEYHLLVISLDYKNTSTINHLEGTIRDAKEFAKAIDELTDQYRATLYTHMLLQESSNADPLASDYPTIENIRTKLSEIKSLMKETDILIVYYAGHGVDGSGDLVVNPTAFPNNSAIYPIDSFVADIKEIKGSKVLIMDSCYSGNSVTEYPDIEDNIVQLRESYDPSLFVISASTKNQKSYELDSYTNHVHGKFTYSLLEALGWNHNHTDEVKVDGEITTVAGTLGSLHSMPAMNNGKITVRSLFDNTRRILFKLDYGKQLPQTGDGPIDMVLFGR
ncbi:MAG: caspase family protein [Sphaerochaetaceae bacterium]|nr:caspase family protein [Spirochaetales bacterium]